MASSRAVTPEGGEGSMEGPHNRAGRPHQSLPVSRDAASLAPGDAFPHAEGHLP